MNFRYLTAALAVAALAFPTHAYAGPDEDVRDVAKADLAKFRAEGWPESRCSLSAYFTDGGVIYDSFGNLRDGDKLLYLGDVDVEGKSAEAIVAVLRGIGPDVVLPIRIERDGEAVDTTVQCDSAGKLQAIDLAAMEFAARKKFPECVAEAEKAADQSQTSALMAYRCALVKKPENYDTPALANRVVTARIKAAHYDPALRGEVVKGLRQSRSTLGERYFRLAVEMTEQWPDGETFFEDSKPDWMKFRKNAERAVLTGFYDPGSATFEWPFGFTYGSWKPVLQSRIEGWWTCGRVNAKNRMGGYVGSRYFVVVMNDDGRALFNETSSGGDFDFVSSQCANSVVHLPPAPREFFETTSASQPAASAPSVADELKKLSDLYEAGALTEEEYKAAKAKILGG
jgi:hypothetical protein